MTLAIERRAAVRYETADTQTSVQLKDWAGRGMTRSNLVNVSLTGAMILADKVPELYRPLWVRLEKARNWLDCGRTRSLRRFRGGWDPFLSSLSSGLHPGGDGPRKSDERRSQRRGESVPG